MRLTPLSLLAEIWIAPRRTWKDCDNVGSKLLFFEVLRYDDDVGREFDQSGLMFIQVLGVFPANKAAMPLG